jgi:hypothetical protein
LLDDCIVMRPFLLKATDAGLAGRPTLLSLDDRDLVFQDRKVVAANGAPTPLAGVLRAIQHFKKS